MFFYDYTQTLMMRSPTPRQKRRNLDIPLTLEGISTEVALLGLLQYRATADQAYEATTLLIQKIGAA